MKVMHVSPLGDDTTGDGSSTSPYKTIEHALSLFDDGDQIRLLEGTYTPADSIVIIGKTGSIMADYPGSAIIQPIMSSLSAACVAILSSGRFTIQGIEVKQDSSGMAKIGILAYDVNHFLCKTCSVDGFEMASGSAPSGNAYGIFGYGNGRIENCHIYDIEGYCDELYGIFTDNMNVIDCEVYSVSGVNSVYPIMVASSLIPFAVTNIVFVI